MIDQAIRDRNLHRPAEKAEAVEEVLPFVRAVSNRIQKREYFDIAMDALRVGDASLRRELWQSVRVGTTETKGLGQKLVRRAEVKPTVAEKQLLVALLIDEELRHTILSKLDSADYDDLPTASIFRALIEMEEEGLDFDFNNLSKKTENDAFAGALLPMLLMSDSSHLAGPEDRRLAAEKCLDALRLMTVNRRLSELSAEIASAERNGDIARLEQLASEHLELDRRRSALRPNVEVMQTGV